MREMCKCGEREIYKSGNLIIDNELCKDCFESAMRSAYEDEFIKSLEDINKGRNK